MVDFKSKLEISFDPADQEQIRQAKEAEKIWYSFICTWFIKEGDDENADETNYAKKFK